MISHGVPAVNTVAGTALARITGIHDLQPFTSSATGAGAIPQIGKHLRVARIRLRAANIVTIPVARRSQQVDRKDLTVGSDQRGDTQPSIGFDPHNPLTWIDHVVGNELVERADPVHSFG